MAFLGNGPYLLAVLAKNTVAATAQQISALDAVRLFELDQRCQKDENANPFLSISNFLEIHRNELMHRLFGNLYCFNYSCRGGY